MTINYTNVNNKKPPCEISQGGFLLLPVLQSVAKS